MTAKKTYALANKAIIKNNRLYFKAKLPSNLEEEGRGATPNVPSSFNIEV